MQDHLKNIRQLPRRILMQLGQLIVNRIGSKPDATMLTRDIVGFVVPKQRYLLVRQEFAQGVSVGLQPALGMEEVVDPVFSSKGSSKPKHAILTGKWLSEESAVHTDANILGGMGMLLVEEDLLRIPVIQATAEDLAFYNARLLHIGSSIQFETQHPLPVTEVSVGRDYVEHYLSQEQHGGGEYIEYHNEPHFWAPKNKRAAGHILLGREVQGKFYLTGFTIPFGSAVYLSPNTLHSDAYLTGDYWVVYTVAEEFSTVLFKDSHQKSKRLMFEAA